MSPRPPLCGPGRPPSSVAGSRAFRRENTMSGAPRRSTTGSGHAPARASSKSSMGERGAVPRALHWVQFPWELEHALGARGLVGGRRDVLRPPPSVSGYRTNVLVGGLVPGVAVGVEFAGRLDCACAGDDGGGLVVLRGLLPGVFEVCVRAWWRGCGCWPWVRRVAPPEHGFASGAHEKRNPRLRCA